MNGTWDRSKWVQIVQKFDLLTPTIMFNMGQNYQI